MLSGGLVVPIMGAKKMRSNNLDSEFNHKKMMIGIQSGFITDSYKNFSKTQASNIFHIDEMKEKNIIESSYERLSEAC